MTKWYSDGAVTSVMWLQEAGRQCYPESRHRRNLWLMPKTKICCSPTGSQKNFGVSLNRSAKGCFYYTCCFLQNHRKAGCRGLLPTTYPMEDCSAALALSRAVLEVWRMEILSLPFSSLILCCIIFLWTSQAANRSREVKINRSKYFASFLADACLSVSRFC